MLEIYNGQNSPIIRPGPSVRTTLTAGTLARANMACGYYNGTIVVSGGFAQPANPYPNNANRAVMSADRLSISSVNAPAGYDGTSTHGYAVGDRLWIAMGHDGAYRAYLKQRVISTGAVTGSNSSLCPGGTRINASVVAENADSILYGLGFDPAVGWRKDMWRYKPSTNAWTKLADAPADSNGQWWSDSVIGPDGLMYAAADFTDYSILQFNPVTNVWSRTPTFSKYMDGVAYRIMAEAGLAVAGKYILFFKAGMLSTQTSYTVCYRYNTEAKTWDALTFPSIPALYSPRVVTDVAANKLFLLGGALEPEYIKTYNLSMKNSNFYIFNLSDFT